MAEKEAPTIKTSPYLNPLNAMGSSIILMTNTDDEILRLEMTYKNSYIDKSGNEHSLGEALMNDEGINSVIGLVKSLVNRITIMSNLNKHEIPLVIDFLGDTLARDLMRNREKYNIRNESARDRIFFTTLSTAFVTMKRAYEEGDKRFWKGSTQEITTRVDSNNQKSGFSKLMGWNK